uniref:CSON011198 protein n=1 Tax=Culicoides sonorensis TaxID=179676 RepID=A0A336K248_CULSO
MGGHGHPELISKNLPEGLRKKMEIFQAKNNLPVFLKGGPVDRVLFGTTVACCALGLLGVGKLVYELGFKKK